MAVHVQLILQAKLYEILDQDATLQSICGRARVVFENVGDNTPFPYVEIGEIDLGDFGGYSFAGFEGTYTIHTWSQARGRKQCQEIMNRIYTLLHRVDLSLGSGFSTIANICEQSQTIIDSDGRTYHGIQRFKLITGGN